jgi:hypothetical protein
VDPDPIQIQGFDDQKLKKIQLKKIKLFGSKTTIYLSLELHKGRPSYGRNLQLSKENIQYLKTCNFLNFVYFFFGSLLPSWIRIRSHWPESEFGSETLVCSLDPDPGLDPLFLA